MAFVNLPPNLQDIFGGITDRISKLETGPNQAMYTAETAQGTAESAQITADNAYTDAAAAAAAAASAQAIAGTAVQVSANTIVNASNQLTAINGGGITVYSGASSSSGARVVLNSSGLAGYNSSNSATFAILASTGEVQVTGGILSGGSITGATINVPTVASPAFSVNALGAVTCTNITINGGQIYLNSGVFAVSSAGYVTATSGSIAGWQLASTYFTNSAADTFLYSNPGTDGLAYSTVGRAIMRRLQLNGTSGTTLGSNTLAVGGSATIDSTLIVSGTITGQSSATFGGGGGWKYLDSSGVMRVPATYTNTISTRAVYINSAGDFGTLSSSQRFKHDIQDYAIDQNALLSLDVKTFKFNEDKDPDQLQQYGFIAEQAQELGLEPLIQYDENGFVSYFAYEKLPVFLLQVIKNQEARIKTLEGN
jgi:hypothetical protein